MKSFLTSRRLLTASLSTMLALTLCTNLAHADRDDRQDRRGDNRDNRHDRRDDRRDDRDDGDRRTYYYSRPRTSFSVNFGTGYLGSGYYYGPVGVPYYYEGPGVVYYANRSAVPAQYAVAPSGISLEKSVQIRLSQEGYYRSTIDGDIGPASQRAISRYQADHGLRVTGNINDSLLKSLDVR